jgi:hypothetical protein
VNLYPTGSNDNAPKPLNPITRQTRGTPGRPGPSLVQCARGVPGSPGSAPQTAGRAAASPESSSRNLRSNRSRRRAIASVPRLSAAASLPSYGSTAARCLAAVELGRIADVADFPRPRPFLTRIAKTLVQLSECFLPSCFEQPPEYAISRPTHFLHLLDLLREIDCVVRLTNPSTVGDPAQVGFANTGADSSSLPGLQLRPARRRPGAPGRYRHDRPMRNTSPCRWCWNNHAGARLRQCDHACTVVKRSGERYLLDAVFRARMFRTCRRFG